jgi:DNA-directed RNA polymerase subunit RPC12/RpoP
MPLLRECAKCGKRILPFIGQSKTVDGIIFCAECYLSALKKAKSKKAETTWNKIANGE